MLQPITRPDSSFSSWVSACFGACPGLDPRCIVLLHLRQDTCFALLWTNDCGSIDVAGDAADARDVILQGIMPIAIGKRSSAPHQCPSAHDFAFCGFAGRGGNPLTSPAETVHLPVSTVRNHCAE